MSGFSESLRSSLPPALVKKCLCLHPSDNVAVIVDQEGLRPEDGLPWLEASGLPVGHKVAIRQIRKGEPVVKFGCPVGIMKETAEPGRHVHVHNVEALPEGA